MSGDEQVLRKFRSHLDSVLTSRILPSISVEKVHQYDRLRRNDIFWRGDQYASSSLVTGGQLDYLPAGGASTVASSLLGDGDDTYSESYNTNIYKADLRILKAVLGSRAPNVNAVARVVDSDIQMNRARLADRIARLFHDIWDVSEKQRQLVLSGGKNGTTFLYTPWVVDGVRYGYSEEPRYEQTSMQLTAGSFDCPGCGDRGSEGDLLGSAVCPGCGDSLPSESIAPGQSVGGVEEIGVDRYENGNVELFIESGLTVTTPFDVRSLAQAEWLRYEFEMNPGPIYRTFPELRDLHGEPSGSHAPDQMGDLGRYTREQIRSFNTAQHYGRYGRWLLSTWWWRPSMFEYIRDDEVREFFKRSYPEGSRQVAVNGMLLRVIPERLDDVWATMVPEEHETMWPNPYVDDSIEFNEQISTSLNMAVSASERSVAFNLVDPDVIDPNVLNRLGRRYAEYVPTNPGMAGQLRDGVRKVDPSDMRPEHISLPHALREFNREITGLQEQLFGGGPAHATLGEAEMKRSQALMMLGPFWDATRKAWQKASQNAVLQFARHSDGNFYVPREAGGGTSVEAVPVIGDLEDLQLGGWTMHADESMPMTVAQQRAYFLSIVQTVSPELIDRMQLFHPGHANVLSDMLSMPGVEGGQAKQRTALLDVVRSLAAEEPVPDVDPLTGEEIAVPSRPPDPFLFDPELAAAVIPDWLLSKGEDRPPEGSPGWQNVYLYGRAYYDMIQPPPLPPEEAGGGEEPPETRLGDLDASPDTSPPPPPPEESLAGMPSAVM